MTIAIARDPIYRRRRFQPEIIELCVRWYLTYRLSGETASREPSLTIANKIKLTVMGSAVNDWASTGAG
jgi:transposase-like protein